MKIYMESETIYINLYNSYEHIRKYIRKIWEHLCKSIWVILKSMKIYVKAEQIYVNINLIQIHENTFKIWENLITPIPKTWLESNQKRSQNSDFQYFIYYNQKQWFACMRCRIPPISITITVFGGGGGPRKTVIQKSITPREGGGGGPRGKKH